MNDIFSRKDSEQSSGTGFPSITVTTSTGKQYTLDGQAVSWIKNRYSQDAAASYGYDDEDRRRKLLGQISVAAQGRYGNSQADRDLQAWGLPSQRDLESYVAAYHNWHTGTVDEVFGESISADAWDKIKELYQQDWSYEDTAEDQQRKARGLMPGALAAKYEDTELDESLMARGLPSRAALSSYGERYNRFAGIDSFYQQAAGAWTNLRLKGIQNDDTEYTAEELKQRGIELGPEAIGATGRELYTNAFYDELERVGDDGQRVHGSIFGLFKNNHDTGATPSENRDYNLLRGDAITGAQKAAATEADYARYEAFSYDDFSDKYEGYYNRYYAGQRLENGKTVGEAVTFQEQMAQEENERRYYTVNHPESRDMNDETSVENFLARYQKDHPEAEAGAIFADMLAHDIDTRYVKEARNQLREGLSGQERRAINDAYQAAIRAHREERAGVERSEAQAFADGSYDLNMSIEAYIEDAGGFTPENIKNAISHYQNDVGISATDMRDAVRQVKNRYTMSHRDTDEGYEAAVAAFDECGESLQDAPLRQKEYQIEIQNIIRQAKEENTRPELVDEAMSRIQEAVSSLGENITPEALLGLAKGLSERPGQNPEAVRKALEDLGFSSDGDFSGEAAWWTEGWDSLTKATFLNDLKADLRTFDDIEYKKAAGVDVSPEGLQALNTLVAPAGTASVVAISTVLKNGLRPFYEGLVDIFHKGDGIPLHVREYEIASDYVDELVAKGDITRLEGYNLLCSLGLQDEIEAYDREGWQEAKFAEEMVPQIYAASGGTNRLAWENLDETQQQQITKALRADIPTEKWEEMWADYDWTTDPTVDRTGAQALGQQVIAIIPSLEADISAGVLGTADMIATLFSGKEKLWKVTENAMQQQRGMHAFGSVTEGLNPGTEAAELVTDVAAELLKMYTLGSIGGEIGAGVDSVTGLSAVAANEAKSKAVRWIARAALDYAKASPFVIQARGNNFVEAKMMGASNGSAIAYGWLTGTLEGVWESLNFDKLFGNVLGQGRFGQMLVDGGNLFKNAGVVAKARIVNMVVSALGEATEEGASYLAETMWKTVASWGGDTRFSWEEMVRQMGMGFLTGFLGAGTGAGNINELSILEDYYQSRGELEGGMLDTAYAAELWRSASPAQQKAWREGTVKVLSSSEYANMVMQADNCARTPELVQGELRQLETKWTAKVKRAEERVDTLRGRLNALDPNKGADAVRMAKIANELANAETALMDVQEQRDAAMSKAQEGAVSRMVNAALQLQEIQKKINEHFAGVYLRNEGALTARDFDTVDKNMARARQNGDKVDLQEEEEKAVNNGGKPLTAQTNSAYNKTINTEGLEDGRTATGSPAGEDAAGGYAGVSGPAGTVRNSGRQEGRPIGRADSGLAKSVLLSDKVKAKGIDPVELGTDNEPSSFYVAIGEAKTNNPFGAFVTQHEVEEYAGMRRFLSADGGVGVAVTEDGNIVSVFKNGERNHSRRAVSSILFTALENGGVKLDNFDSVQLSNMYLQHGFVPVARIAFNEDDAPDGWNYERDGRPDILFWVHNGDSADVILEKMGTYEMPDVESLPLFTGKKAYDEAKAYRDSLVNENTGWASNAQQVSEATTRTLTDEEVSSIRQLVKEMGYRYQVDFIDDNSQEAAWFDSDTGRVVINRANITGADAQELSENPGFWLLKHEWTHFIEGSKYYADFANICRDIMMAELEDGAAGYQRLIQGVQERYAQKGVELDREAADRELVAFFAQDRLFTDRAAIRQLVANQKGDMGSRVLGWIRYKINDMKLRRQKNSAVSRSMLQAERLYAQAFRDANKRPNLRNQGEVYAIGRTMDNRPFVEIEEDILDGVPQDQWQKTVAAEIKRRFKNGIDVNGQHIEVTGKSVGEITHGAEARRLRRSNQETFADKMRAVSRLDEITEASTDYVNEATKHERENDVAGFGRGKVLIRVGSNDYSADVVIANRKNGAMLFYDVTNIEPTNIVSNAIQKAPMPGRISAVAGSKGGPSDNGIVTPGQTTVNSEKRQFSTGLTFDELVKKYGAKQQGKGPRERDIQVPERISSERRVSDFLRSFMESDKMADSILADVQQKVASGELGVHTSVGDEKRVETARKIIAEQQPLAALQTFQSRVLAGQTDADTNALGLQLLADAAERGDTATVLDVVSDLTMNATKAGQSVQVFSIMKELKGLGSAWYMNRLVQNLNRQYAEKIAKGKMLKISLNPEVMEQLTKAQTVEDIMAAEEAAGKDIARQLPLSWAERLTNWRYMSMLLNPTTHMRNLTGNLLMGGMVRGKDAVATGLEQVFVADENQRSHAVLNPEDKAKWSGFAEASFREQLRNLQGGGKLGLETFVEQHKRMFDTKWLNALALGSENGKNLLTRNGAMGMLEVEDMRFIRPAYENALMQRMKAQGYTLNADGTVGKVDGDGVFHELTEAQKTAAVEWASEQAWMATFHDASALCTLLNKLSRSHPALHLLVEGVMPFKKTPINIAKRGVEYSPVGIVTGIMQMYQAKHGGSTDMAHAIDRLASGITGTALMTLGMCLKRLGAIRAGADKRKKYENYLRDTGEQTYAFYVGNVSVNLSALAPSTIPLFMGVALMDAIDGTETGERFDLEAFTNTFAGVLNPFMEMSFMSSLNSALATYEEDRALGVFNNIAKTYASQYIPTIGGKVAQFIDPVRRTTKSSAASPLGNTWDSFGRGVLKKVPGLEMTLEPDVDAWGRRNVKDSFFDWLLDFANKFALPGEVKVRNRDVVDNELVRLVESTGSTAFLPSDGNKYFKVDGVRYDMTAKQYTQYSQERGQAVYAALKETMRSLAYRQANDERKAAMLEKALKAAQDQVNTRWKELLGAYD